MNLSLLDEISQNHFLTFDNGIKMIQMQFPDRSFADICFGSDPTGGGFTR